MSISTRFSTLARLWFGSFSKDELKKFTLLGITYACIIGLYWTLRATKDSVFMSMVGGEHLNLAKIISVWLLLPVVLVYTKLLSSFPRHRMLYFLAAVYGGGTIIFGLLFLDPVHGLGNTHVSVSRLVGWLWYAFVESYGSLMPALFWAFATDTTGPDAARRGFPLVVTIAQTLSIMGPLFLTRLAHGDSFGSTAYVVIACGMLLFLIAFFTMILMKVVPQSQLVGYRPAHESDAAQERKKPGFFDGLKLLVSEPYLLSIFLLVGSYETIITLIDYNFKNLAGQVVLSESARTMYFGHYATWINIVSAACLWLGASNIQRRLGLRVSLVVMPVVVGFAVAAFYLFPVVTVLFWVMVGAKALNYAINSPSIKQLYVPTSADAKYQSQAWIDTFGARGAKALGSGFSMIQKPLGVMFGKQAAFHWYLLCSTGFSSILIVCWVSLALYLGSRYRDAVEHKEVIGQ